MRLVCAARFGLLVFGFQGDITVFKIGGQVQEKLSVSPLICFQPRGYQPLGYRPSGYQPLGYQLLALSLVLALLFGVSYLSVMDSHVVVAVLLVGLWWMFFKVMFWQAAKRRQLGLVHMRDDSPLRGWLQGGLVMRVLCGILAIPPTLVLLVLLSQGLELFLRVGLVCGVGLWAYLEIHFERLTRRHIKLYAATFFRQWLLFLLVGGVVFSALLLVSFWSSVPDLPKLDPAEAFAAAQSDVVARVDWLHSLAGFLLGLDYLVLWAVERLVMDSAEAAGGLPTVVKLCIWGIYLGKNLVFVFSILVLMQGASLISSRLAEPLVSRQETPAYRLTPALALVFAVAIATGFIWDKSVPQPWRWLTGATVVVSSEGHIYEMTPEQLADARANSVNRRLDRLQDEYAAPLNDRLDRKIDRVFDDAIEQVPAYADWYFSLSGKLLRTASHLSLGPDPKERLMNTLFPGAGLKEQVQALTSFQNSQVIDAQWQDEPAAVHEWTELMAPFEVHPHREAQLRSVSVSLDAPYGDYLAASMLDDWRRPAGELVGSLAMGTAVAGSTVYQRLRGRIKPSGATAATPKSKTRISEPKAAEKSPSRLRKAWRKAAETVDRNTPEFVKNNVRKDGTLAGKAGEKIGAGGRWIGHMAGRYTPAAVQRATVPAVLSVQRVGLRVVPRLVGRRVLARVALSAGSSLICGPAALACGAAVFIGSTVASEWAFLKYDAYANKDDMERGLVVFLDQQRQLIKQAYHRQTRLAFSNAQHELEQRLMQAPHPRATVQPAALLFQ